MRRQARRQQQSSAQSEAAQTQHKAGNCGTLAASPRPAAAAATQGHCLLGKGTSHLFLAKSHARVMLSRSGAVVTQQSSRNTLPCSSAHITSSSCSMRHPATRSDPSQQLHDATVINHHRAAGCINLESIADATPLCCSSPAALQLLQAGWPLWPLQQTAAGLAKPPTTPAPGAAAQLPTDAGRSALLACAWP